MHFITILSFITLAAHAAPLKRAVDSSLVPEFGHASDLNPTGTGDCDGIIGKNGKPILIPCLCPPTREKFIQTLEENVLAGHVVNNPSVKVTFPTDASKDARLARLETAAVTLQNLNGVGKGCPMAATTFGAQRDLIRQEQKLPEEDQSPGVAGPTASSVVEPAASSAVASPVVVPASSVVAPVASSIVEAPAASSPAALPVETPVGGESDTLPLESAVPIPTSVVDPIASSNIVPSATPSTIDIPPAPSSSALPLSDAEIKALAPVMGHSSGLSPDGTGNCDGAVLNKETGKPIAVPCSCPPTQEVYLRNLIANVKAGNAVNNPTVAVSFPTGDSKEDARARITAALISLQNLNGVGKGCPASATTLGTQMAKLDEL